jgi:hypothetical protein
VLYGLTLVPGPVVGGCDTADDRVRPTAAARGHSAEAANTPDTARIARSTLAPRYPGGEGNVRTRHLVTAAWCSDDHADAGSIHLGVGLGAGDESRGGEVSAAAVAAAKAVGTLLPLAPTAPSQDWGWIGKLPFPLFDTRSAFPSRRRRRTHSD